MFVQKLCMLGDITVIEICYAHIQQDIKHIGIIENRKIKPVINQADGVLDRQVNPEDPERFDQQVKQDKQSQVDEKLFLHAVLLENCYNIVMIKEPIIARQLLKIYIFTKLCYLKNGERSYSGINVQD